MAKGPAGIRRETSLLRLVRAGTIAARKAAAAKKKRDKRYRRDKRDKRDKRMITEEFIGKWMEAPEKEETRATVKTEELLSYKCAKGQP